MTTIISGSSPSITFSDSTTQSTTAPSTSTFGFKNRIINGGMVINQRALGTFTPTTAGSASNYSIDRWTFAVNQSSKLTTAQSSTAPTGFNNSLLVTSSSAYTPSGTDYFTLTTRVEAYNTADLGWGTANAKTVTLSFQVYSSLTGTFGGNITNSAENRSYPFTYTISSANTWTTASVTIAGDTSGTWLTTNGTGIELNFSMGMGSTYGSGTAGAWTGSWSFPSGCVSVVGTNGATFYITGVQLEVGTQATSFDFRDYGRELMMCQRYFQTTYPYGTPLGSTTPTYTLAMETISQATTSYLPIGWNMPIVMRTTPTATLYNPNTGSSSASNNIYQTSGANLPSAPGNASQNAVLFYVNNSSLSAPAAIEAHFAVNAEL